MKPIPHRSSLRQWEFTHSVKPLPAKMPPSHPHTLCATAGQIESYKERFGYYRSSVHADSIYRNHSNRSYCDEHGIRLTGKPLGRSPKQTKENQEELRAKKKQMQQDERDRIPVERKFGNLKRKGSLGRIMAKLSQTAESLIHVDIIVFNLEKYLREIFCWLIYLSLLYFSDFRKLENRN